MTSLSTVGATRVNVVDSCGSYCNMYIFADDVKFYRHIEHPGDQIFLQLAISALHQWSEKWMYDQVLTVTNAMLCPMALAVLLTHPQCILLWTKINRQFR